MSWICERRGDHEGRGDDEELLRGTDLSLVVRACLRGGGVAAAGDEQLRDADRAEEPALLLGVERTREAARAREGDDAHDAHRRARGGDERGLAAHAAAGRRAQIMTPAMSHAAWTGQRGSSQPPPR